MAKLNKQGATTNNTDLNEQAFEDKVQQPPERLLGFYKNKAEVQLSLHQVNSLTINEIRELADVFCTSFTYMYPYAQVIELNEAEAFFTDNPRSVALQTDVERYRNHYIEKCNQRGKDPFEKAGCTAETEEEKLTQLDKLLEYIVTILGNTYKENSAYGSFAEEIQLFNQYKDSQKVVWLIARDPIQSDRVAGLVMLDYRDAPEEVYCRQLAVIEDYCGTETALGLMLAAKNLALRNQIPISAETDYVLATRIRNTPATSFYKNTMSFSFDSDEVVSSHGLDPKKYCSLRRRLYLQESENSKMTAAEHNLSINPYGDRSFGDLSLDKTRLKDSKQKLVQIPMEEHHKLVFPDQVEAELAFLSKGLGQSDYSYYVREEVWNKLNLALDLLPRNIGLMIIDGYRPYDVQKKLFDEQVAYLKSVDQNLSTQQAEAEASAFSTNPDIYSPHLTGGAIDLGLVDLQTMKLIDVGNNYQYDDSAKTLAKSLTKEQQANRKLLLSIMTAAGFVNYEGEWWHYSYGDAYYALVNDTEAIYGTILDPQVMLE